MQLQEAQYQQEEAAQILAEAERLKLLTAAQVSRETLKSPLGMRQRAFSVLQGAVPDWFL